nr:MAG TPA: hypothetical protein [Caudoviricetes sp.]
MGEVSVKEDKALDTTAEEVVTAEANAPSKEEGKEQNKSSEKQSSEKQYIYLGESRRGLPHGTIFLGELPSYIQEEANTDRAFAERILVLEGNVIKQLVD